MTSAPTATMRLDDGNGQGVPTTETPIRDLLRNRKLLNRVFESFEGALDSQFESPTQLMTIEAAVEQKPFLRRLISKLIIRKAHKAGVDVERAAADGTLINWIIENWDEIAAFLILVFELVLKISSGI